MNFFRNFSKDESGSGHYMGVGAIALGGIIYGVALDTVNAVNRAEELQVAADAAALAAAANIDDQSAAVSAALQTVNLNLSETNAITAQDIQFGHIDESTLAFTSGPDADGNYRAVQVDGFRTLDRSTQIDTYLLNWIGVDEFETDRFAVAAARLGGGSGALAACEDATVISEDGVNTGGGITLLGAVCIHGAEFIQTGGNDWYGPEVRFSSEDKANIKIEHYSPGDIPIDQLKFSRVLDPVILPNLQAMHDDIWADLYDVCNWGYHGNPNDPDAPNYDDFEPEGTYSGTLLPSFVMDGGQADVVCLKNHTNIQPTDLNPYTIYVADGGVQFAGNVQQDNIAIISTGRIGVGGGDALAFDNVFFFGNDVGLAGNITWGPRGAACQSDEYQVYLFGLKSLSLGGWTNGPTLRNLVGVAPSVSPGGNMSAAGIYIETESTIQLGGGIDITGCGYPYTSEIEIADTAIPAPDEASGSYLFR